MDNLASLVPPAFLFIYFESLLIYGCTGSLLLCAGFSLPWILLLQSTDSRAASIVVAHGLSFGTWHLLRPGIQSMSPALADPQPLDHQGSPHQVFNLLIYFYLLFFFWPRHMAGKILVPQPGIKHEYPAVKAWS